MNAPDTAAGQLCWTRLGLRMGYTGNPAQRMEILAAVDRMTWVDMAAGTTCLAGPVARAMARSILRQRSDETRLTGVAKLDGQRRLIGMDDGHGARLFLLDLDAEAVVVLTQTSRPMKPLVSPVISPAANSRPATRAARQASRA